MNDRPVNGVTRFDTGDDIEIVSYTYTSLESCGKRKGNEEESRFSDPPTDCSINFTSKRFFSHSKTKRVNGDALPASALSWLRCDVRFRFSRPISISVQRTFDCSCAVHRRCTCVYMHADLSRENKQKNYLERIFVIIIA